MRIWTIVKVLHSLDSALALAWAALDEEAEPDTSCQVSEVIRVRESQLTRFRV